ncbi:MAG: hypothetical protein LUE31_05100 [Lachnospiraceae bacterium]|nr:hypothetical protein [Lachnospiraceae bacterium]
MRRQCVKRVLTALCAGVLLTAVAALPGAVITAYATETDSLATERASAISSLKDYQRVVDPDGNYTSKLNAVITKATSQINAMETATGITEYVTKTKADMDAIVSASDDDEDEEEEETVVVNADHFLMVGGNWVTPVANAGQSVSIVLPVINMGKTDVSNAVVTPVLSTDSTVWPFEITQSSYSQTITDLPGTNSERYLRYGPPPGADLESDHAGRRGQRLSENLLRRALFRLRRDESEHDARHLYTDERHGRRQRGRYAVHAARNRDRFRDGPGDGARRRELRADPAPEKYFDLHERQQHAL